MLSKLTIKNVALIENAEITFKQGLNVLSGETGAGKSVILDSVNFVLGAKADRSMIRHGEAECMVKAEFLLSENAKAVQELRDLDIDSDGEVIISRKFSDTGKNSIKINGNTVTATMLRKVTDSLVDVHGQSEHFFLLKESNQLKMLDSIIGKELDEKKQALISLLKEHKEVKEQLSKLCGDEKERNRRLELLKFQIDEIVAVDLKDGEEDELLSKKAKITNLEKIIAAIQEALSIFSSENGVLDGLRYAERALTSITKLDEEYANVYEKLEELSINAEDVSETLSDISNELYFDENEAAEVESRLDCIRNLKRKYGANKNDIDAYLTEIQEEYEFLSDCEGQYVLLNEKRQKLEKKIYQVCLELTELRKTHGETFCARVIDELKTLNIPKAQFSIEFSPYSIDDVQKANVNGLDEICFLFSANAGEPTKPIGKIISGGEMSRFMLAIKTQLSSINEISTYIFDEIDAGISGKTAKVVGEKLARIAKNTQILAVSHLAQIAALSDKAFLIEKQEDNEKTRTRVYALNDEDKIKELVRLLGGEDGEEFAVKHAEELLKQANEYKKSIN